MNTEPPQPNEDSTPPLRSWPIFRILIAVVVVLMLGGVAVWFASRPRERTENVNAQPSANVSTAPATFDTRVGIPTQDADNDGLTDEEETQRGTNPQNSDSDGDGLSDFDELRIYLSDPNKTDSDGDGHADGDEVKQGFSPTGSGKLFDTTPPASTDATP